MCYDFYQQFLHTAKLCSVRVKYLPNILAEARPGCGETCSLHPQELFEDRGGKFHETPYLPNFTMPHVNRVAQSV